VSFENANISTIIEELFQTMDEALYHLKANTLLQNDRLIRFDFDSCTIKATHHTLVNNVSCFCFLSVFASIFFSYSHHHLNAWQFQVEIFPARNSSKNKLWLVPN